MVDPKAATQDPTQCPVIKDRRLRGGSCQARSPRGSRLNMNPLNVDRSRIQLPAPADRREMMFLRQGTIGLKLPGIELRTSDEGDIHARSAREEKDLEAIKRKANKRSKLDT